LVTRGKAIFAFPRGNITSALSKEYTPAFRTRCNAWFLV